MPKVRAYTDTSVVGGVHDEEFAEPSRRFFERVRRGDFILLISQETTRELRGAPEAVRRVLTELPPDSVEEAVVDEEVRGLAAAYLDAGVVGPGSAEDAIHVAAATVARADLILSWNFKHLVRYDRIRKFNGVNAIQGYPPVDIRSPLEVAYGGDREESI